MKGDSDRPVAGSFRDPSGFLFHRQGTLFRQVNSSYQRDYDLLMTSGLYDALVAEKLLVPHQEEPRQPPAAPGAYKVIRPLEIAFVSYPWEWCFSQLKAAALTTLRIQTLALEHGMSLKDASAYNIQFHAGAPLLIDTLSFEAYEEGRPWIAYRQFCQHFLAPLSLISFTDHRLSALFRVFIDGVPLDLASRLLPLRSRLRLGLATHLHLQASVEARFAAGGKARGGGSRVSRRGLLGILDSLEGAVRGLRWTPAGTTWADYYSETNYSDEAWRDKQARVETLLRSVPHQIVWDLGANTGVFSRIAAKTAQQTIAFDMDMAAVERGYRRSVEDGEGNILTLVLSLENPSPGLGWANRERLPLLERGRPDLVLALALIHHLAIGNNLPFEHIAEYFREIAPSLIIEFVPKSDSQVQRMLSTRADIFPNYHQEAFEKAFSKHWEIREAIALRDTERRLYLLTAA